MSATTTSTTLPVDPSQTSSDARTQLALYARQLSNTQRDMTTCATEKRRLELTLSEIQRVPDNTPTYRAVGRAFLAEPKDQLASDISRQISRLGDQLHTLKSADTYLTQKIDDTVASLKHDLPASQ